MTATRAAARFILDNEPAWHLRLVLADLFRWRMHGNPYRAADAVIAGLRALAAAEDV